MRTAVNIGLILALVVAAPVVGLFTAAGIYMAAHMIFLGIRPIVLSLAVAAGASLVMYGFFGVLLGVQMPGAWLP